jgi:hypothetical protein
MTKKEGKNLAINFLIWFNDQHFHPIPLSNQETRYGYNSQDNYSDALTVEELFNVFINE